MFQINALVGYKLQFNSRILSGKLIRFRQKTNLASKGGIKQLGEESKYKKRRWAIPSKRAKKYVADRKAKVVRQDRALLKVD